MLHIINLPTFVTWDLLISGTYFLAILILLSIAQFILRVDIKEDSKHCLFLGNVFNKIYCVHINCFII